MYAVPLIGLLGVCGVPAMLAAAIVAIGRLVYVATRPR